MVRRIEEYNFSFIRRRELVKKLFEAGFTVTEGGNVYISDPKDGHPRIGKHFLPVGYINRSFARLVNLDEAFFEDYHSKLKEIYSSVR